MTVDEWDDIPEYIPPSVTMAEPNDEIVICDGFVISDGERSISINGKVKFVWLPENTVKFYGQIIGQVVDLDQGRNYKIYIENALLGDANITRNTTRYPHQYIEGYCREAVTGDASINVSKVSFAVPNIRNFHLDVVKVTKPEGHQGFDGRIHLETDKYIVEFNRINNYPQQLELLRGKGGYLILGAGEIIAKKGRMSLKDVQAFAYCLSQFLFFFNGNRVSVCFLKGSFNGETKWTHYARYKNDPYKYVASWSDVFGRCDIQYIWKAFVELWKDAANQDFIESAIHWYVEANSNSGYLEGSIILAQTALELIYNWLLVENKKLIIGEDAERISASNKIRLLLSVLHVSSEIPASYNELIAIKKTEDGPEIFVNIRNALVHGQEKKRKQLINVSPAAKAQALHLSLWYIELSLLYVLKYKGIYRNRISQRDDQVPWTI